MNQAPTLLTTIIFTCITIIMFCLIKTSRTELNISFNFETTPFVLTVSKNLAGLCYLKLLDVFFLIDCRLKQKAEGLLYSTSVY